MQSPIIEYHVPESQIRVPETQNPESDVQNVIHNHEYERININNLNEYRGYYYENDVQNDVNTDLAELAPTIKI